MSRSNATRLIDEILQNGGYTEPVRRFLESPTMLPFGEQDDQAGQDRPVSSFGLTAPETLQAVEGLGQYSQEDANYHEPTEDPMAACGACRFYLRHPEGDDLGACQVVEDAIAWFGTCGYFIDAAEEAAAILVGEGLDAR